jgi:hypothetical protein
MSNPITKLISGGLGAVVKEIGGLVDKLSTTEEEKLEARRKLLELQSGLYQKALEADAEIVKAQASVVQAEAQSESWLTRNWRPLTMLVFTFIVFFNHVISPLFALPRLELTTQMWDLLTVGIGGYVAGRSLEKIVPAAAAAIGEIKTKEKK